MDRLQASRNSVEKCRPHKELVVGWKKLPVAEVAKTFGEFPMSCRSSNELTLVSCRMGTLARLRYEHRRARVPILLETKTFIPDTHTCARDDLPYIVNRPRRALTL